MFVLKNSPRAVLEYATQAMCDDVQLGMQVIYVTNEGELYSR